MSLVSDLQSAALDDSRPIANVLRYAKVLAARTRNDTLRSWVDQELEGYSDVTLLPDYRVLQITDLHANFSGWGGSYIRERALPAGHIPEEFRDWALTISLVEGVAHYEGWLDSDAKAFQIPLPAAFVVRYLGKQSQLIEGFVCTAAWRPISAATLRGVLDTIRSRVLDLALELEAQEPNVTSSDDALRSLDPAAVEHAVTVNVLGGTNTIVGAATQFNQIVAAVNVGDWESLAHALTSVGVATADVDELREALDADGAAGDAFGSRVKAFLKRLPSRLGSSAERVGIDAASATVGALILKYLGIS